MKCPVDEATLLMSERQGVEIDYCPECRGVWLDRGELDKLVARDAAPSTFVRSNPRDPALRPAIHTALSASKRVS